MEINNGLVSGLTPEQAAQVAPRPDFMTPYTHLEKPAKAAGNCTCGPDGPFNIFLIVLRDVIWWLHTAGC